MDRDEMHVRVFAVLLQSHRAATGGYLMPMPKAEAIADEATRVVDKMRPRRPRDEQGRFLKPCSDMAEFTKPAPEKPHKLGDFASFEPHLAPEALAPCELDHPHEEIGPHGIAHPQEPLQPGHCPILAQQPIPETRDPYVPRFLTAQEASTAKHFRPDTEANTPRSFPGVRS